MERNQDDGRGGGGPSGDNGKSPYGANERSASEADGSFPSGANGISPSGDPSEAEESYWLGCSLVVDSSQS